MTDTCIDLWRAYARRRMLALVSETIAECGRQWPIADAVVATSPFGQFNGKVEVRT